MSRLIDLTGRRFGRLMVLRRSPSGRWYVQCDCGRETVAKGEHLRNGSTRSCGCLSDEVRRRPRGHGLASQNTRTPEYNVWRTMRARCTNPRAASYKHYGARGIIICKRWDQYENFIADMGLRPPGYMIERIDVNGDYAPANCIWASPKTQQRNRRNNRHLMLNGQSKTVAEWAEVLGVPQSLILVRLHRGWSVERALTVTA